MATCANPDCSNESWNSQLAGNWVQVAETTLRSVDHNGGRAVQTNMAAVTCSRRCAIAILSRDLEIEEARRAKYNPFASVLPVQSE